MSAGHLQEEIIIGMLDYDCGVIISVEMKVRLCERSGWGSPVRVCVSFFIIHNVVSELFICDVVASS